MDFALTPEQTLIRQTAAEIAQRELAPQAAALDIQGGFPREAIRKLAGAGLLGMTIPPAYGGSGADTLSLVLATEALAKACANTALVTLTHLAVGFAVTAFGTPGQKEKLLPQLARGDKLAALVATEPDAGSNALATQTAIQAAHDGYLVNGTKAFITSSGEADLYMTLGTVDRSKGIAGLTYLLAEKDRPGLSFGRRDEGLGLNGSARGEVVFQDCAVPRENLLGPEGGALPVGMAAAALAMLGAASISLGLAQAALDASIQHCKERVVAGQPLGAYQGLQFLISDMSAQVDAARSLLYHAVFLKDTVPGPPLAAFKAKLFATEMAVRVTDQALQLHGAHGYSRELPVERYYRDARGMTLHFQNSEMLKESLGKMLLGLM
ncbi:MAG TPA: acyl-CoA dehydrogenase family protein [Dehalococcoidia bacterium]|nr:acyl-CoA dehydrogenase family protein [Dehalococcoidia bacterium]